MTAAPELPQLTQLIPRRGSGSSGTASRPSGLHERRAFLTLPEFLAELDVPRSTFFRWKALGLAPRTYKLPNGQLRIRRTDYEAWLAGREEQQVA